MKRSLEDLLGDDTPSERPRQSGVAPANAPPDELGDWAVARRGVSLNWLAGAFQMDRKTVKARLADCPPSAIGHAGAHVYNLAEAASYLVEPRVTPDEFFRKVDVNKLPPFINLNMAKAKREWLRYNLEAGDAWRTEDVVALFGEVFLMMKDQMTLWAENLSEKTELTTDQLTRIRQHVDALQSEIHAKVVDLSNKRKTYSWAVEIKAEESAE